MLAPVANPRVRQSRSTAAWQSGAPFAAVAQSSRPATIGPTGSCPTACAVPPATAAAPFATSLAASLARVPSLLSDPQAAPILSPAAEIEPVIQRPNVSTGPLCWGGRGASTGGISCAVVAGEAVCASGAGGACCATPDAANAQTAATYRTTATARARARRAAPPTVCFGSASRARMPVFPQKRVGGRPPGTTVSRPRVRFANPIQSKDIESRNNASHEHENADRHPESQSLLDDLAGAYAVTIEQECREKEAQSARDYRERDEHR